MRIVKGHCLLKLSPRATRSSNEVTVVSLGAPLFTLCSYNENTTFSLVSMMSDEMCGLEGFI